MKIILWPIDHHRSSNSHSYWLLQFWSRHEYCMNNYPRICSDFSGMCFVQQSLNCFLYELTISIFRVLHVVFGFRMYHFLRASSLTYSLESSRRSQTLAFSLRLWRRILLNIVCSQCHGLLKRLFRLLWILFNWYFILLTISGVCVKE